MEVKLINYRLYCHAPIILELTLFFTEMIVYGETERVEPLDPRLYGVTKITTSDVIQSCVLFLTRSDCQLYAYTITSRARNNT